MESVRLAKCIIGIDFLVNVVIDGYLGSSVFTHYARLFHDVFRIARDLRRAILA